MNRYNTIRISLFRVIALGLLAVSAAFTFPESHYSAEKTFIKSPAPQTELCTLLADDIEDSNDFSTGAHIFNDFVVSQIEFPSIDTVSTKTFKEKAARFSDSVYILFRQLLI